MCGGVGFKIKNIPEEELKKYYSKDLIQRFIKVNRVESFFWQKDPVLPIKSKQGIQLKLWGNKDKDIRLPKTGWAREESLGEGRWDYLEPEMVDILVDSGYEKKTWFELPSGTKGAVVKRGGEERVYIITREASKKYREETGHGREPLGKKKNYESTI